jgi:acetyl-CoA synthetase
LGDRIQASGSRLVFTADITYRKGKDVQLKSIVDGALDEVENSVEHVVVLRRNDEAIPMKDAFDITWDEFMERSAGQTGECVPMEANEPAFILATSGTTAKHKLAIHTGPSILRSKLEGRDRGIFGQRCLHVTHSGPPADAVWGCAIGQGQS